MKKFEAGNIYCEANRFGHDGCNTDSRIYVHSACHFLVFSHISADGKMWSFSVTGKDRSKILVSGDSEYVWLPIGICGTRYCAEYELPVDEVQND